MFDFRADIEPAQFGQPVPNLGTAIEFQRIPVFKDEEYTPENLALRSKQYKSIDPNVRAYYHYNCTNFANIHDQESAQAYDHLLESGIAAYQTVFKHIRDHPDKGILYHCTSKHLVSQLFIFRVTELEIGGKDRTGVLTALILKV